MPENHYLSSINPVDYIGSVGTPTVSTGMWNSATFAAEGSSGNVGIEIKKLKGQKEPEVYFRLLKRKFKPLEKNRLKSRLKKLEKAFDEAMKGGQEALGQKFLYEFSTKVREAQLASLGIKFYVERDEVQKYRHRIRGGHISDTLLRDYTRVIPKKIRVKIESLKDAFDGFVILHYWNEQAADVAKMDPAEKSRMKDPILFGIIRENNRLYYVADWKDEFCDLTFDELTTVVAKGKV